MLHTVFLFHNSPFVIIWLVISFAQIGFGSLNASSLLIDVFEVWYRLGEVEILIFTLEGVFGVWIAEEFCDDDICSCCCEFGKTNNISHLIVYIIKNIYVSKCFIASVTGKSLSTTWKFWENAFLTGWSKTSSSPYCLSYYIC